MTAPAPSDEGLRRPYLIAVAVALALTLAAAGLHLAAGAAASRAYTAATLSERAAAARLASGLEPWDRDLARQASVLTLWDEGERLLEVGDYNAAVDTLREAYRADVGNAELLALFKEAQEIQALDTNRKAHLQHGHEGPGGTLGPEDLER
jgi:hypothetical protein